MGTDDLFKKRRAARQQRNHEYKNPKANSYLIVTVVKKAKVMYQNIGDGTYKKNYEEIYALVNRFDGVNTAIKNAKRRMADFEKSGKKPLNMTLELLCTC